MLSAFDIIKIGVGPSSSHTMGPWEAALQFLAKLKHTKLFTETVRVKSELYGSLAKTGAGHGTDVAIKMGLSGIDFRTMGERAIEKTISAIDQSGSLILGDEKSIPFSYDSDMVFHFNQQLDYHPNGLTITAYSENELLLQETYFSVGGGFIEQENAAPAVINEEAVVPFNCATELQNEAESTGQSIFELIQQKEKTWRTIEEQEKHSLEIWDAMLSAAYRAVHRTGVLPGGLNVKRRSPEFNRQLLDDHNYTNPEEWLTSIRACRTDFESILKWVSAFALAVNEENASFGRIVTAPTNGAAGVLPSVLLYHLAFNKEMKLQDVHRFMLIAGQIGAFFKQGATISAAQGGCQAEIGVSSAMAAAALTDCRGGSPGQVMMAAEIAMEHHLGLTCDPVGGLVQIPCIERNTMGAVKAITACNLALASDPKEAKVSLDAVIETMWETALDMNSKYKETSEGGLAVKIAVNLAEC
ncbi:L-serine ammonia-lyase [Chitinophagales bacterium]|nr:L-serine ammonia-lyase [Chitinophagales bacterium]